MTGRVRAAEMSFTVSSRCEENDYVNQELKAYVSASGNRPNPHPVTELSV